MKTILIVGVVVILALLIIVNLMQSSNTWQNTKPAASWQVRAMVEGVNFTQKDAAHGLVEMRMSLIKSNAYTDGVK